MLEFDLSWRPRLVWLPWEVAQARLVVEVGIGSVDFLEAVARKRPPLLAYRLYELQLGGLFSTWYWARLPMRQWDYQPPRAFRHLVARRCAHAV